MRRLGVRTVSVTCPSFSDRSSRDAPVPVARLDRLRLILDQSPRCACRTASAPARTITTTAVTSATNCTHDRDHVHVDLDDGGSPTAWINSATSVIPSPRPFGDPLWIMLPVVYPAGDHRRAYPAAVVRGHLPRETRSR